MVLLPNSDNLFPVFTAVRIIHEYHIHKKHDTADDSWEHDKVFRAV